MAHYDEQLHNFNVVPGLRLLPRIPFHSRKFSIVIPGYFLEMVQRESPSLTIWIFSFVETRVFPEPEEVLLDAFVIGLLGNMVSLCPTLSILPLRSFHRLISLTPTPYSSAIFPR